MILQLRVRVHTIPKSITGPAAKRTSDKGMHPMMTGIIVQSLFLVSNYSRTSLSVIRNCLHNVTFGKGFHRNCPAPQFKIKWGFSQKVDRNFSSGKCVFKQSTPERRRQHTPQFPQPHRSRHRPTTGCPVLIAH
jgi:hypothetical protein